jgi:hypothetical protein
MSGGEIDIRERAKFERNRCRCDDPGVADFIIGEPNGAIVMAFPRSN